MRLFSKIISKVMVKLKQRNKEVQQANNCKRQLVAVSEAFSEVLCWLCDNSQDPDVAAVVWYVMCFNLVPSSRRVALTLEEIAEKAHTTKDKVATIINKLVRIRAVHIKLDKQGKKFFLININVCRSGRPPTHEELENEEDLALYLGYQRVKSQKKQETKHDSLNLENVYFLKNKGNSRDE